MRLYIYTICFIIVFGQFGWAQSLTPQQKLLVYDMNSKIIVQVEDDVISYEFYDRMVKIDQKILLQKQPKLLDTFAGQQALIVSRQKMVENLSDLILLAKLVNDMNVDVSLEDLEQKVHDLKPKYRFSGEDKKDYEDYLAVTAKREYLQEALQKHLKKQNSKIKFNQWYSQAKEKVSIMVQQAYVPKRAGLPIKRNIEIPIKIDFGPVKS